MTASSDQFEQSDDYALLRAIAERDVQAMRVFYDRHSPLVYALCLRMLRNRQDAEDLLVRIMMEVWESADRYDPARSSPRTYLMMLTRSRAIDAARSRASRGPKGVPLTYDPGRVDLSADDPAERLVNAEDHQRIRDLLQDLEAGQREAIEMAYFDGLTQSQIADRLKLPLGTVKSRVRLGLIKLRDQLRSSFSDQESKQD